MTVRPSRSELIWFPLVLAGVLAIYLVSLGNLPVFDDAFLTDGELFAQYRSLLEFRARMLSYGSFVWLHALLGDGWWKQRLVNLAIHIGVVVALWALYREILRHIAAPAGEEPYEKSPALGFAVAVFALNPVAVYAVAYLIQRSILMATLFVVLGLWFFVKGVAQGRPLFHALAVVCYVLAVTSKEYAITAPLAAMPLYVLVARPSGKRLAAIAAAGAVLVAIAAYLLSLRYGEIIAKPFDEYSRLYLLQLSQLSPDAAKNAYPLSIMNQAWLFFEYGVRWIIPYSGWMSISMRPPFPVAWGTFPQVLGIVGYLAVLAGGSFLLFRHRDWRAFVSVSFLLPATLFMTEFATVWVQDPFVLYRSYLWAIGIPGLVFFAVHGASPRALLALGIAIGGLFAWQAIDRVLSLQTPESAWSDAISKLSRDPRSVGRWFPYLNRGAEYVERNDFEGALRDYEASAALGDMGMGTFNIGSILAAKGRHPEALAAFDRAEKEGYNLYNLPFQRGLSLQALGKPLDAYREFAKAHAMDPPSPTRELLLLHLGRTTLQLGRKEEALKIFQELVTRAPSHKEGRFLLAMAYVANEKPALALPIFDTLVRDGNAGGPAYYGRALAHYALKRKAEALADIETAMRLGGNNPNLREWHAKITAMP